MGRKLVVCVAFVVGACGGGSGGSDLTTTLGDGSAVTSLDSESTTITADGATTTSAAVTTSILADTTTVDPIAAVPPECIEPFQDFLVGVEPAASEYDFEGDGMEDFQLFMIAISPAATEMVTAYGQTTCLDPATGNPDPAIYDAIIDWTQQNAPGSLTWLEVQQEMQEMGLGSGENCSGFLEIHEEYVARGGTVFDLTRAERFHAYSTFGAIHQWCDLRTAGDYGFQPEVLAFMVLED